MNETQLGTFTVFLTLQYLCGQYEHFKVCSHAVYMQYWCDMRHMISFWHASSCDGRITERKKKHLMWLSLKSFVFGARVTCSDCPMSVLLPWESSFNYCHHSNIYLLKTHFILCLRPWGIILTLLRVIHYILRSFLKYLMSVHHRQSHFPPGN